MFSGIIEEIGEIKTITLNSDGGRLAVICQKIRDTLKLGDSVAINGICLTVSDLTEHLVKFDIMSETFKKTNFKYLRNGDKINLERALLATARLDGHIVQGHIDCIGKIIKITRNKETILIDIQYPRKFICYTAPRGAIAVDGVSLTIAEKKKEVITVALVEFTQNNTTLKFRKYGEFVNLEFDIIGKYAIEYCKYGDYLKDAT